MKRNKSRELTNTLAVIAYNFSAMAEKINELSELIGLAYNKEISEALDSLISKKPIEDNIVPEVTD